MLPNLGGINPQKMLQKMQDDMLRVQEQLDEERLETSSGGGMVKVTTTGQGEILEIAIAPEVVDPNDIEMLQDLIVTGVRDAMKKGQENRDQKMSSIMGSMPKIPGLL